MHSNDSLDIQVNTYISEGRFHVALLSLCALIAWVIYLFFYNSRVFGFITSMLLRKFVKSGYVSLGLHVFFLLMRNCRLDISFNRWWKGYDTRSRVLDQ